MPGVDELITAIQNAADRGVVFLLGSGVPMPVLPGVQGFCNSAQAVADSLPAPDSGDLYRRAVAAAHAPAESYQTAFGALADIGGDPKFVNQAVRHAILAAVPSVAAHQRLEVAASRDRCLELEEDPGLWKLTSGLEALGQLLLRGDKLFVPNVLTSNFDPLVQIAVRRAGGSYLTSSFAGDAGGTHRGAIEAARNRLALGVGADAEVVVAPPAPTRRSRSKPKGPRK